MKQRVVRTGWRVTAAGLAIVVISPVVAAAAGPEAAGSNGSISPAQTDDGVDADDDEFDGRSTRDTVRLVVGSLIAIAGATTLMMFAYVWHTSPRRRLRIASRRAERRQAKALLDDYEGGFETSFFGGQAVAVGGGGIETDLGVVASPAGPADFDLEHLESDGDGSDGADGTGAGGGTDEAGSDPTVLTDASTDDLDDGGADGDAIDDAESGNRVE